MLRLELATHRVVVGPRDALGQNRVALHSVNWLGAAPPEDGMAVVVKLRSSQPPVAARLYDGGREVALDEPAFGVAPGQACVFYDGPRCLGGGWIARNDIAGLTRRDAVTNIRLPSVAG